ncbi:MAG: hypothetical protein FWF22_03535, partial [Treponema sp.]|nr:hypothetical protein [Treponema sp.]
MVQMLFYLRFRSQLRRTRPDLVTRLDETITGAIFTAGGRLSDNRRFLNASFDSDRIGFWLDILILIETILKALENAGSELSGHAMILSQNIPEHEAERLCLTLSSSAAASHTGIWCGQAVRDSLQPYCIFENPFRGYVELENLIPFNNSESGFFPYREKIAGVLAGAKKGENTLLLGSVTGIRDGVYRYCTSAMKDAPPLVIRFSTGDCGPGCLCDALTPAIREYLASSSKNSPAEMETLAQLLFRERLRDQVSPFLIEAAKRFLELLLKSFRTAASGRHSRVFVILEDLFDSGSVLAGIIRDTLSLQENRNDFVYIAYGCGDSKEFREWNTVFTRVIKLAGKDFPAAREDLPKLSADLLEMMYTFTLLRRFFPPALFPQLFEEEGLNPGIPDKAVQLLLSIGAMDFLPDPRPCLPEFLKTPEKIAGEAGIKKMVCSRLLAWEKEGRIRPCFNLLRILHELGAVIDDPLILRVLRGEIDNGTSGGMEAAFSGGQIGQMTNRENIKILNWIFNARKALVSYVQNEIHGIFSRPSPVLPASVYQGFRAELLSNLSAYRLGCRDSGAASETVRELMLVNQNLKDGGIPSYRYFSLVNLLRLKIDDTLEYGSFAMELAEKTGNGEELVKASFFTAASGFLNGDLSLAQKLTVKTEKTALDLGWVEWALRSRFFLGR